MSWRWRRSGHPAEFRKPTRLPSVPQKARWCLPTRHPACQPWLSGCIWSCPHDWVIALDFGEARQVLVGVVRGGRGRNGVVRTKLALTHEDISQLIGTRRETITRTLSEFRKLRIVELKGSTLIIRNKTALVKLVAAWIRRKPQCHTLWR